MHRLIHGGVVVALLSAVLAITAAPLGAQTLTCGGLAATIVGTEGDDVIDGTSGDDVIVALGGNDEVTGGAGFDRICLGAGDDRGTGGKGEDFILGGAGNDLITGGNGGDFIDGGRGADTIRGKNGTDVLLGGRGQDLVIGGAKNDQIQGNDGDDELRGGKGNDEIFGGSGDDAILAGRGQDLVDGEAGFDVLDGGRGDDIVVALDNVSDTIDGSGGTDTCIFDGLDLGRTCELGDIASHSGEGNAHVDFDPTQVAQSALPGIADGPYFVLQYEAFSTQEVQIEVVGSTGAIIESLLIPAGITSSRGNVIIQGTPTGVDIFGADEWHVGIVSSAVFSESLFNVSANFSAVFSVDNAPDGTVSEITFTNPLSVDSFAVVVVAGPAGIVFNAPLSVPAGTTQVSSGTLFADDQIIGVFAPGLEWEYVELN